MQRHLIIHHDDADGVCSAAIAYNYLVGLHGKEAADCKFIAASVWDPFPEKDIQETEDTVYVLDFSYRKENMAGIPNLVWIDHHKTAIEEMKGTRIDGIRKADTAACELAWRYFFTNRPIMPWAVRYVGDRDMWKFKYGNESRYFHEYLEHKQSPPDSNFWQSMLSPHELQCWACSAPKEILDMGRLLYESKIKHLKQIAKDYGRPFAIRGNFKGGLSVNYPGSGDLGQIIYKDFGYGMAHCFHTLKNGQVRNSLYSDSTDVSVIAKALGGGGHPGAAGWISEYSHCEIERIQQTFK